MAIRAIVISGLFALVAGCGPDEPVVMDRGVFIDVMIELRRAAMNGDEESFASTRDEILASAGVTDSMLVEFARVRGSDATFMAAVWDSIDRVVNEVPASDELVPDTAGPS